MMLVEGRGNYNPKVVSANFAAIPQKRNLHFIFKDAQSTKTVQTC